MASGQKKVIIRQQDGELAFGYLPSTGFTTGSTLDFLDLTGRVTSLEIRNIRWIAYVKDFNRDDSVEPEQLGRRTFASRPRLNGLWLRLTLASARTPSNPNGAGEELLEGIADFDLTALNALADDQGLAITPPDGRSNTLRLFIPRLALRNIEILGWIGATAKPAPRPRPRDGQPNLFADDAPATPDA